MLPTQTDQLPSRDEETHYDVFVSYARADNATGWATTLVDFIRKDHAVEGTLPLRVFFDAHDIVGMNDWRHRIEGALRRSRVLLVCLSPAYRDSDYCLWEWAAFQSSRSARRAGHAENTAIVRFVEVPGADAESTRTWIEQVQRTNYLLDLKDWFADHGGAPTTPHAWAEAHGQAEARRIFRRLWDNIRDERIAQRAQGNLRGGNPHFVGRNEALRELHRVLALGRVGVVCAVQGLGGIGKTELALQYGYEHAWHYSAGLWQVQAEGRQALLPLLATLADDSAFLELHGERGAPLQFTPAEQADAALLGRRVLKAMLARAQRMRDDEKRAMSEAGYTLEPQGGGAVLVILDNVDAPTLLSQRELAQLPELNQARDRIRFLATTRRGKDDLPAHDLRVYELGRLSREESLALIVKHRAGRDFPDAVYAAGVDQLLTLLDGYTLAVEQVAVYLGLNDDVRAEALAANFRAGGLGVGDSLLQADPRVRGEILHGAALMDIVLDQTLQSLEDQPLARAALDFAAWLPPEHISWPWLEGMVRQQHAGAFDALAHLPNPWARARARLKALQLLPDASPGVAWLHRVIADHLRRRQASRETTCDETYRQRVDVWVAEAAFRADRDFWASPASHWQDLQTLAAWALAAVQAGRADVTAAVVCDVVAGIELSVGALARAGLLAEFAVRCRVQLAAGNPADRKAQRALSISLDNLAGFLQRRAAAGDAAQALTHLQRSLAIFERLAAYNPADRKTQRDLSISLEKFADFLQRRAAAEDAAKALAHRERSLAIRERLAAEEPADSEAQSELASSLADLAGFLHRRAATGDAAQALIHLQRSLAICERLAADNPANSQAQRGLSISLNRLAAFLERRAANGDAAQVLTHLQRSLAICERLAADNPANSQAQRDLSLSLTKLAGFLQRRAAIGDADQVFTHLQRSLAISERLAVDNPADSEAQRDLWLSLVKLADFLQRRDATRDAAQAFTHLQRSLAICERLAADNPADSQAQRDLSISLNKLAAFMQRRAATGDAAQALTHLQRSLAIRERLAADDPADGQAQRDLAVTLEHLAGAVAGPQAANESISLQHRAFYIHKTLFEQEPYGYRAEALATAAWNLAHYFSRGTDASRKQGEIDSLVGTAHYLLKQLDEAGELPADLRPLWDQLNDRGNGNTSAAG